MVRTKAFRVKFVTEFVFLSSLIYKKQKRELGGGAAAERVQLRPTPATDWDRPQMLAEEFKSTAKTTTGAAIFPPRFISYSLLPTFQYRPLYFDFNFIYFFSIVRLSITVLELTRLCSLLFTSASVTTASCWEIATKTSVKLKMSTVAFVCLHIYIISRLEYKIYLYYIHIVRWWITSSVCISHKKFPSSIIQQKKIYFVKWMLKKKENRNTVILPSSFVNKTGCFEEINQKWSGLKPPITQITEIEWNCSVFLHGPGY